MLIPRRASMDVISARMPTSEKSNSPQTRRAPAVLAAQNAARHKISRADEQDFGIRPREKYKICVRQSGRKFFKFADGKDSVNDFESHMWILGVVIYGRR